MSYRRHLSLSKGNYSERSFPLSLTIFRHDRRTQYLPTPSSPRTPSFSHTLLEELKFLPSMRTQGHQLLVPNISITCRASGLSSAFENATAPNFQSPRNGKDRPTFFDVAAVICGNCPDAVSNQMSSGLRDQWAGLLPI